MYTTRMVMQALVALFVCLVAAAQLGYAAAMPPPLLTACAVGATAWLVASRTTWLPFLGPTVMPTGIFGDARTPEGADYSAVLRAPASAVRCVFWGSIQKAADPFTAYGAYTNAGVADVVGGTATISLKRPVAYSINGTRMQPHVHYRWVGPRGMLSGIRTRSFSDS